MNKILRFALIAATSFVFSCSSDSEESSTDGGTLTITDIPAAYDGKYAYFEGEVDTHGNNNTYYEVCGAKSIEMNKGEYGLKTYVQISNGTVNLPLWKVMPNSISGYSGNDTFANSGAKLLIFDNETSANSDIELGAFFPSITFSNGSATISFNASTFFYP